jgi:Arc/MetJ-type ribon-helix-helix transcriptional regulator
MTEEKKQTNEESTKTSDSDAKRKNVLEEFGDSVGRFATKTFESIKQTIDKSLDSRNTVLTIRVNEEANKKLNMLVDTGIFKSRSESAAFLIEEGIKQQAGLFKKISEKLGKIEKIKDELKDIITEEMFDKEKK